MYKFVCWIIVILTIVTCLCCASCGGGHTNGEDNPQDTALVIKVANDYYSGKIPNLLYSLDTLVATHKHMSEHALLEAYMTKANYLEFKADYESAIRVNDTALSIILRNGWQKKLERLYVSRLKIKAQLLYNNGNYAESFDNYFLIKQMAESEADTFLLADYVYSLGMLSYKQKNFAASADYFKQAVTYGLNCDPTGSYGVQENLDNVALCYEHMGKFDSALYYYDSVIRFLGRNADKMAPHGRAQSLAVVYGNKGSVLLSLGATDSAIALLKMSYEISIRPLFDNQDAVLTHLKLAKAYLARGDLDVALEALVCTRKELDSIHHPIEAECTLARLMCQYYENTYDLARANKFHHQYNTLRDSFWANERKRMETDAIKELLQKQQSYKVKLLEKQRELNNVYIWISTIVIAMAIAIIILVFVNYRKSRKNITKLTALKLQLEQKDKEKDKIMDIVVHDLRGPVSGISTVADMMLAEGTKTLEDEEWITMIKGATESALALINDLMGYKKDEREALVKEPVDIAKLTDDTVKLLQLRANKKLITLVKHVSAETIINIDKEKINRVITNLVVNAIKFSNKGATIHIDLHNKVDTVLISVKDNGIGIPEKLQSGLFSMFTASKRAGTGGEKSFGLGLSITKQIVEAHNGKIWLESAEGKGTTFFVELPK